MLSRRVASSSSLLRIQSSTTRRSLSSSALPAAENGKNGGSAAGGGSWARRAAAFTLLGITGGVAYNAIDELAVFLACSSRAIEKATQNQKIVDAIGKPIVRGPWYNASIAVNHKRHSVSCTFPVSGPQGAGIFKLKAAHLGDDSWYSLTRYSNLEILLMDAILDVRGNDGRHQTIKVTLPDYTAPPPATDCKACKS